jgi:hypothetical protein
MTVTPMICQHIALKLSVGEQAGAVEGRRQVGRRIYIIKHRIRKMTQPFRIGAESKNYELGDICGW